MGRRVNRTTGRTKSRIFLYAGPHNGAISGLGGRQTDLREVVSRSSPVKIPSTATASDALVSMIEHKTDYLLVDRAGPHDAYGIVTKTDLVVEGVAKGIDLTKTAALELARKPLVVMNNLDLDIQWVAKKMVSEGISRIAVFEKEKFLGFISDVDILRAVAARKEAKK